MSGGPSGLHVPQIGLYLVYLNCLCLRYLWWFSSFRQENTFFINYQFFNLFKSRLTEMKNITLNSNVDLEFFAELELPIGQSNQSQWHLCQMITADKLKATNDEICYRLLILIIAVWPTSWYNELSPFQLLQIFYNYLRTKQKR